MTQPNITDDRLRRLQDALPAMTQDEFFAFARSLLTPLELSMLHEYQDFKDVTGKDTDTPPQGRLTTLEQMLIAWYRQHSAEAKAALLTALQFANAANELWKTKAGAE